MGGTLLIGDSRELLRTLPDQSVHCCVTSPPYFGLRDYGTADWEGGDPGCDHKVGRATRSGLSAKQQTSAGSFGDEAIRAGEACPHCGATRVDRQIGLEPTPDEFVAAMVDLFSEVHRVLRDDGTLWLNLGDSYATGTKAARQQSPNPGVGANNPNAQNSVARIGTPDGLKTKDLIGIPWRVALALQADGWYLRQDIIWAKPNPMPESVRDRCTKSHEYLFMLSKRPKYFFDAEAIKEPAVTPAGTKGAKGSAKRQAEKGVNARPPEYAVYNGWRNKRDVWQVASRPFKEAHFATFPPDLIEPCILAGTSATGVCADCGAPHVREVKRKAMVVDRSERTHEKGRTRSSGTMLEPPTTTTTGWQPSCECGSGVVPATVLDPFFGAGTTGLVAERHGRQWIGCELNPEYAAIAQRRIAAARPSPLTPREAIERTHQRYPKTMARLAQRERLNNHGPLLASLVAV